jgi:D-alanyl-D-alanine carboxypeptidase (penicillin-binding protein 5/6)
MDIGADGMKTGFTDKSGYAIVGSVAREGRRLFVAMSGMETENERAEEARKLLDWGIRAFARQELYAAGETVGEAKVYGGAQSSVKLEAEGPLAILVPITNRDRLVARIVYSGPLIAPVEEGSRVGALKVWIGDTLSQETPLFASESIGTGSLYQRALGAVEELLVGWLR